MKVCWSARPGSGYRVCSYSMQDISDANEIRGLLEGLAARLAAERGVAEEALADCREILAGLDAVLANLEAMDFAAYVRLMLHFTAGFLW